MSKRISPEARVVEFFDSAPLAAAESVFGIVAHKMKARRSIQAQVENAESHPAARRTPRKKRKVSNASPQEANTASGGVQGSLV